MLSEPPLPGKQSVESMVQVMSLHMWWMLGAVAILAVMVVIEAVQNHFLNKRIRRMETLIYGEVEPIAPQRQDVRSHRDKGKDRYEQDGLDQTISEWGMERENRTRAITRPHRAKHSRPSSQSYSSAYPASAIEAPKV